MTRIRKCDSTKVLEIAKQIEFTHPIKRLATRRFLKEKYEYQTVRCDSTESIETIKCPPDPPPVTPSRTPTPTPQSPPEEQVPQEEEEQEEVTIVFISPGLLSENWTWEDAFFSAVPFCQVKHHDASSKTCICDSCVENPTNFDVQHLFSDEPLEFSLDLRNMVLRLNTWKTIETIRNRDNLFQFQYREKYFPALKY